jgi:hypothetical protein
MANKDVKKIKSNTDQDKYAKIKYLSNWLQNPNKPPDILIEDLNYFNTNLKYRLFTNVFNNPKVCFYINKYLNNLYFFHSDQYKPLDWLKTFADIVRINNIKNFNTPKYQNLKRNQFTKLLNDYLILCNHSELNQEEINNLFLLFEHNIITVENIENIQDIISGKESKESKIAAVKTQFSNVASQPNIKDPAIVNFCNIMNTNITNKNSCRSCPGYQKGNVILDTNLINPGEVDINVICNVSPSREDVKQQVLLAENLDYKNYLIDLFTKLKLTYTFTNVVLCYNNVTDAAITKKIVSNCSGVSSFVTHNFPAKLNLVLGAKVAKELGIKSFNKQIGFTVNNKWFVMNHPNEIAAKNLNVAKQFENLISLLNKQSYKTTTNTQTQQKDSDNLLVSNKPITDFTLFDIQIIGNKVIYIVLDKDNNKEYIVNEFNIPIHIKYGNFKDCSFISDKVDFIAYVNAYEKRSIQDKLLQNLKSNILKYSSTNTDDDNEDMGSDFMFESESE